MIQAEEVTVTYRRGWLRPPVQALDRFTLTIEQGSVFGLLGPNGAGKSTAMYCFLGLIRPNSGYIKVAGGEPQPGGSLFERIGYLPEEPHYHLYLTVEEAARFYSSLYRRSVGNERIESVLRKVGLWEHRDRRLEQCSKGMKQKLGIAVCLVQELDILFLDEPTRGLDPVMVKEFRDLLIEMNHAGTTIVLNSHVLSEVEMICNRVAVMDRGRVLLVNDLQALLTVNRDQYVVIFEEADELPAFVHVTERSGGTIRAWIPIETAPDFFQFCLQRRLTVTSCTLDRLTLEQVFMSAIGRDTNGIGANDKPAHEPGLLSSQ